MTQDLATRSGVPRLVVLTANGNASNSYTIDWVDAFAQSPLLRMTHIDLLRPGRGSRLRRALREADGVVLLHTATADDLAPIRSVVGILQDRQCPLLALIGNEINLPWAPLSEKIALMNQLSADIIGTQLLAEAGEYLYGGVSSAKVVSVPHAAPEGLMRKRRPSQRPAPVIGTRSAQYLPILGDVDRVTFFDSVSSAARRMGWTVDVSQRRFDREGWHAYLGSLDVTIATEAGSWFTRPTDDIVTNILADARRAARGGSIPVDGFLRRITRQLPWKVRARLRTGRIASLMPNDLDLLAQLDPGDIYGQYFSDVEPSPVYTKAASSRHLEAAAVGTPQLLLAGRYNDIFVEGVDYISVSTDLSDLEYALEQLADPSRRKAIAAAARATVLSGHTLQQRIVTILQVLFG